jgi:hypothetical protein
MPWRRPQNVCTSSMGKDPIPRDEVVTPDEPSARGPRHTPAVAGTAAQVPKETDALPASLGAALAKLLELALDTLEERSRSAPSHRQAATHRAGISPPQGADSASGERPAALRAIASLVAESARLDGARPEQVVHSLRALWSRVPRPITVTPDEWDLVYHWILGRCLEEFHAGP